MTAAQQLTLSHVPSQPDREAQTRATWYASYRQARRQLRPSSRYTVGTRYGWTLDALRNRFGAAAWPITQAAARLAFDVAMIPKAPTGTTCELHKQGLVRITRR